MANMLANNAVQWKQRAQICSKVVQTDNDQKNDFYLHVHLTFNAIAMLVWILQHIVLTYIFFLSFFLFLYRRYRYLSYRMFVSWVWGSLGRHIRVPIPACVVSHLRRRWPDSENEYRGFMRRALNWSVKWSGRWPPPCLAVGTTHTSPPEPESPSAQLCRKQGCPPPSWKLGPSSPQHIL